MNNTRRKQISEIALHLEKTLHIRGNQSAPVVTANDVARLLDYQNEVEALRDEEDDYYNNMPEGLQSGQRGSASEEALDYLSNAADYLEQAHDALDSALLEVLYSTSTKSDTEKDELFQSAWEEAVELINNAVDELQSVE